MLADQIREALDAVEILPVQVEPRMVITPSPLTIDIYPSDPARDAATASFDDDGGYLLTVRARINAPDFDSAYDLLIALMDDEDDLCLAQTILDDPTLNGHATDVAIFDYTGLRAYESLSSEGGYLGFQLTANVLPARS